jgi:ATP/maltotriose-dependent transcriptional regulator MalT
MDSPTSTSLGTTDSTSASRLTMMNLGSPLRGRAEPMTVAMAVLRRARDHGSGGVLLISGPAGIGKTALLSEICKQAATMRLRVAISTCDESQQVWPGAPLMAALRAGTDPLLDATEYEQVTRMAVEPLLLADRIASHLESAAGHRPLLIAVDDTQWADRVTRFVMRTVISRLVGLPVVWLLASRDDDTGRDLMRYDPVRVDQVPLGPLSNSDLAAIAQDRLGRVPDERIRRYLDAADGNPFLAVQIIDNLTRSAARGEPDTVAVQFAAAIAHRLGELAETPRDLVRLIAVAGRPLPTADVTALMARTPGPGHAGTVADAIRSGLLMNCDNTLAFRHDLVREAVYSSIPNLVARQLHRRFADYHLNESSERFVAAWHARAAATPGDVSAALILVSVAETLAGINADEAADLATLASHTVSPAQAEWMDVALRCLSVLCRTQRAGDAIALAETILARVDDRNLIGQIETEAARALWLSGRVSELASRVDRILQSTALEPAVIARLRAARALASTRMVTGDLAAREAGAAIEEARTAGDYEALSLALQAVGEAARNQGRHGAALRHFRELRSLTGVSYLAEEITALQFLDRYDHAQALLDQARADSRNATETVLPSLCCAQVWQDFYLGRGDEAEAGARTLIELGQQLGNGLYTVDAVAIQVGVSLWRGDVETATNQLRQVDRLTIADDGVRRPVLGVMRGWLAASQGDLQSALRACGPVLEEASQSRSYWPLWPCWNGLLFELGTAAADKDFSDACVDIAESAAALNPEVATIAGLALHVRGRSRDDLDMIVESATVLGRSPRPLMRAVGAASCGKALLAAGQRSAGLTQLDLAWDEYHQMGASAMRSQVQLAMRQVGARRAKWSTVTTRPSTGWLSLTDAERRVAALIGDGHTNKSAASTLGVSINTVGTHLRAVFTKLSVQSRVQLANAMRSEQAKRLQRA